MMSGTMQQIKIYNLINYFENPRHAVGSSEEDTLKKLFEAVGVQYMLNLAEDIQTNGLLGNQQIVVVYSNVINKFVVYEGNRRIAAIKLLLNPTAFRFLNKATIEKAKMIGQKGSVPDSISCYVTDEQEAFFIMERLHSGEDRGRGIKQWTPREKEIFRVRQSQAKNVSYLIDFYIKRYFDSFDITTVLPFTTIQRLFNNREVKKQLGLDTSNEATFTPSRMQTIIDASEWVVKEAEIAGIAVTRLFNRARTIEDKLVPWLQEYMSNRIVDETTATAAMPHVETTSFGNETEPEKLVSKGESSQPTCSTPNIETHTQLAEGSDDDITHPTATSSGGNGNLPYFFQGLAYGSLDPNNPDTHGVSAVCRELQLFSDKKLVSTYPIATTFLVRSLIEQTLLYYSRKHKIQGQNKLIWDNIKDLQKLSKIIENFKRNLPNYIPDKTMRQYFNTLFGDYETNVDPLNWVVHKPAEFLLDTATLVDLPRKGLLALINYMLS